MGHGALVRCEGYGGEGRGGKSNTQVQLPSVLSREIVIIAGPSAARREQKVGKTKSKFSIGRQLPLKCNVMHVL